MAHDVFISYADEDVEVADAVCRGLEAAGLRVWIAPRNIAPGQQWPAAIIDGIEGSRVLVLIFSSHANQSDQVARELERAAAKRVPILSFRIENVDPAGSLEYFIGVVQWIDATTAPRSAPLAQLVETIRALSAPRHVEPAARGRFRTALDLVQERLQIRRAVTVGAVAVATGASVLAVMSALDFFALDARVQSLTLWLTRPWVAAAPSPDLVLVSVGSDMPRDVWRDRFAVLLDRLSAARAKVVAFDLFFETPSPDDDKLRRAVTAARERGTAVQLGVNALLDGQPKLVPALQEVVSGWGALCVGEKLGYAWIAPLAIAKPASSDSAPRVVWSLPLLAVAAARNLDLSINQVDESRQEIVADEVLTHRKDGFRFSATRVAHRGQKGCPVIAAGDRVHSLMIALSPISTLRDPARRHSLATLTAATGLSDAAAFAGKIVLVGVENVDDQLLVPGGELRYGFELQADAIQTLSNKIIVRPLGQGFQLLISILMALVGGYTHYLRPGTTLPRRRVLLTVLAVAYLCMSFLVTSRLHLLLNTLYHLGALVLGYVVAGRVEARWTE